MRATDRFIGPLVSGLLAILVAVSAGRAAAEESLVVVELYTSQGCSSCPPADALLTELAAAEGVLPLALHVDYWDYIGWKDHFAQPGFTARQKAYARANGHRMIYTPQMVVGGSDEVAGNRPMELGALIAAHQARAPQVELRLSRSGETLEISAEARRGLRGPLVVQLVRFNPSETVAIDRGENAGRTITYSNIVTEWRRLGEWSGASPLRLRAEVPGPLPAAVILQERGPGAIVGAAALR